MTGWNGKIIYKIKPWVQALKGHWLWDAIAAVCKSTVLEKGYFLGLSSGFPANAHLSSMTLSTSFLHGKRGVFAYSCSPGLPWKLLARRELSSSRISAADRGIEASTYNQFSSREGKEGYSLHSGLSRFYSAWHLQPHRSGRPKKSLNTGCRGVQKATMTLPGT